MLSRVARQRNLLYHLRHSKRPSLTTLRSHSQSSRPSPPAQVSANDQHERPRRPSFQSNRHFATATEQPIVGQGSYGPYEDHAYPGPTEFQSENQFGPLFPPTYDADPSSLVIVDDFLQTKSKVKKWKTQPAQDEMLANLDICLKVGQFEQAASIISRVKVYYAEDPRGYLDLNNRYLEAMVSNMIVTRQHQLIWPLQRWLEVDMHIGNVKPDANTYAIMVKMALRMLYGSKRDRTVRRYWELAKAENMEGEVLASPILSELELGELSEVRLHFSWRSGRPTVLILAV